MHPRIVITGAALALSTAVVLAQAPAPKVEDVEIVGHVYRPAAVKLPDGAARQLKVPAGFRIDAFATNLGKPRIIAVSDDGTVYVTRREPGDLVMLRDADGDGRAERQEVVLVRRDLHGITLHRGRVYLATVKEVLSAPLLADGRLGDVKTLVSDLPDGGQHPNRTLEIGPDNMLYVSVGSTCNGCRETNVESATLLRMDSEGGNRKVFASGLRNTIGFGWHPATKTLYGMDHGIDFLGDDEQAEELNELREGEKYGWPYAYGDGAVNPQMQPPPRMTRERWAQQSIAPLLTYTAHAAPMQMAFYRGSQFPPDYQDDAFVAMHGSWNRKPPSGYEVVRVKFDNGRPAAIEPFVTGFVQANADGHSQLGRPVGLAVTRDGALLVGDDENGVIYRVWHPASRGTAGRR
jgi:glucose/arabinose dehydrogenase